MPRAASPLIVCFLLTSLLSGCPLGGERTPDPDAPHFITRSLPAGTVGVPYHVALAAQGGTEPRRFEVPAVPPGFSFYPATGILEGTPREAGLFPLTITVTDAAGRQGRSTFELLIHGREGPDGGDDTPDGGGGGPDGGTGNPDGGTGGPDAGDGDPPAEDVFIEVANWNVEWFGHIYEGPWDEDNQLEGVAEVIRDNGAAIWALVEVVDGAHFHALLSRLTSLTGASWQGVVADDASVTGGSWSYDTYEQKPALLWKTGTLSQVQADVILSDHDYSFAGRPPLRIRATIHAGDDASPISFVVVHLKANAQYDSQERRRQSAIALRDWLLAQPADAEILVLGDWNDDLDDSIAVPLDTPFRPLLDRPELMFLTERLTQYNVSTTTYTGGEPIDHQLATDCLAARYVTNSVWVEKTWPTGYDFPSEISDHYPVRTRFRFNADWQPCP